MRKFLATRIPRLESAWLASAPRMNFVRLFCIVVFSFPVIALAASPTPANPDAEFDAVADEYIRGYLAAHPLKGTALGLHEYDGRISDFTRLSIDAEVERLKRFDERLKKFDLAKLNARNGIDLRLLLTAIQKELFQIQDMGIYDRNPMTYAQAINLRLYVERNFASLEDRAKSIVLIENQAPNIMIAAKTNLADVLPKPYVELAIQIARGTADYLRKDLVDALHELKDETVRGNFQQSNRKAAMALSEYANWLEKDKLPKATPNFALGPEKFQRMLAGSELIDLPPAKLLELGLTGLKFERQTFLHAAKRLDPKNSPADVFKQIQSEHATDEDLLPEMAKKLDLIRQFVLDHHLVTIPSPVRPQMKEMPQERRATSFASVDTPGPFEKKATEAYYFVTPPEAGWPNEQKDQWLSAFNNYSSDMISMHEVFPGHYVQFLHLNASKATKAEKIFGSYAFIEGWAHYCEQVMIDAGYNGGGKASESDTSPAAVQRAGKYRMAENAEAMKRLCRLCVAVRMHTQGMSIDEATKFFQQNSYLEEKPARAEAMRGTFDPEYLDYSLGKMEIAKLRKDFEAQEGTKFSAEKFHDALLDHGMLPIRLLRELLLSDKTKWGEFL